MSEIFTMGEPMVVFIAEKPGTFSEVENYSRGLAGAELNFSIGVIPVIWTIFTPDRSCASMSSGQI